MSTQKLRATASTFVPNPSAPAFVPRVDAPSFVPSTPRQLNPKASSFVPTADKDKSQSNDAAKSNPSTVALAAAPKPTALPTVPSTSTTSTSTKPASPSPIPNVKSPEPSPTSSSAPLTPSPSPSPSAGKQSVEKEKQPAESPKADIIKLDGSKPVEGRGRPDRESKVEQEPAKPSVLARRHDKANYIYSTEFLLSFQPHYTDKPSDDFPDIFGLFDEKTKAYPAPKPRPPKNARPQRQPSFKQVEVLQRSENGYAVKKDTEGLEKLTRVVMSLLNKLTPEKLESLLERAKTEIVVTNVDELRTVVGCIFEKAIAEPLFSATYALFCVRMVEVLPKFTVGEGDTKETHSFKRCLLNQCQAEFENSNNKEKVVNESNDDKASVASTETHQTNGDSHDHQNNKQSSAQQQQEGEKNKEEADKPAEGDNSNGLTAAEQQSQAKRRMLGSIRFIGELFVRGQLTGVIMIGCINTLLTNPEEEALEVLCQLLHTVGQTLAKHPEGKIHLDHIMERLDQLANSTVGLSSRVKFLIKDVLDLNAADWVPRIKKVQPKKVGEIKKEEMLEKQQQEDRSQRVGGGRGAGQTARGLDAQKRGKGGNQPATPGPTPKKAPQPQAEDDEWECVSGKKGKKGKTPGPSEKKKNKKGGAAAEEEDDPSKQLFSPKNAFASLMDNDDEDGSGSALNSKVNGDGSHMNGSIPNSSGDHDQDNDNDVGDSPVEDNGEEPALDESVLREIHALLDEFFSGNDVKEAALCVREKVSSKTSDLVALVARGLVHVVEMKHNVDAIPQTAKLFSHLNSEKILATKHITRGIHQFCRQAGDLSIDNPRIFQDAAQIFTPLLADNIITLHTFNNINTETKGGGQLEKLIGALLKELRKVEGEERTQDMLRSSSLNVSSFLRGTGREADFISRYELGALKW